MGKLAEAAEVYEPTTGRVMQVWTDQPGVQFYTGNFLDGTITGKEREGLSASLRAVPGDAALSGFAESSEISDHRVEAG